ncbi:hypothetical protein SUGI_0755990 [Cryptomeria japonica]|nr:hypothetical protein SUGI_0755990 [Cryptomeria japonica]
MACTVIPGRSFPLAFVLPKHLCSDEIHPILQCFDVHPHLPFTISSLLFTGHSCSPDLQIPLVVACHIIGIAGVAFPPTTYRPKVEKNTIQLRKITRQVFRCNFPSIQIAECKGTGKGAGGGQGGTTTIKCKLCPLEWKGYEGAKRADGKVYNMSSSHASTTGASREPEVDVSSTVVGAQQSESLVLMLQSQRQLESQR